MPIPFADFGDSCEKAISRAVRSEAIAFKVRLFLKPDFLDARKSGFRKSRTSDASPRGITPDREV